MAALTAALLLPSALLARLEQQEAPGGLDILLRDALLLAAAAALQRWGFGATRSAFVALACFAAAADLLNQLTHRLLPQNAVYRRAWAALQQQQAREAIVRLLEVRAEARLEQVASARR